MPDRSAERRSPVTSPSGDRVRALESALIEAMRLNTALAQSVISQFPAMMAAAAGLLRAAASLEHGRGPRCVRGAGAARARRRLSIEGGAAGGSTRRPAGGSGPQGRVSVAYRATDAYRATNAVLCFLALVPTSRLIWCADRAGRVDSAAGLRAQRVNGSALAAEIPSASIPRSRSLPGDADEARSGRACPGAGNRRGASRWPRRAWLRHLASLPGGAAAASVRALLHEHRPPGTDLRQMPTAPRAPLLSSPLSPILTGPCHLRP
jgi:hypothetical protein